MVGKRGLERVEEIGGRFGGEYLFPELGILKPYRNVEIEIYVGACLGERVYLFRLLGDIALQGFSVCGGNTAEKLKAVFVVAVRVNAVKSVKIVACDVGGIVAEIHVLARVLGFCRIISRGVGASASADAGMLPESAESMILLPQRPRLSETGVFSVFVSPETNEVIGTYPGDVVYVYVVYEPAFLPRLR